MNSLFSLRNTTVGAGVLMVLVVLFTDQSGVGGSVVGHEAETPPPPIAEPVRVAVHKAPPQWFTAAEPENDPRISQQDHAAPPPDPNDGMSRIEAAPLTGADFPPGLAPPR